MKKQVYIIIAVAAVLACLAAILLPRKSAAPKMEATPVAPDTSDMMVSDTPAPTPSATPAPMQKAKAALGELAAPTDYEGLKALRAQIDIKLKAMDEAASSAGYFEDKYYSLVRDDVIGAYIGDVIDPMLAAAQTSEDKSAELASYMLELWSEIDEVETKPKGYFGLIHALCEGKNMFSMQEDATDIKKDGAWPKGYFFDDFLPPLAKADAFYVCEDYLKGYGMDGAVLYSIGVDGVTMEQALEYFAQTEKLGLYAYDVKYDVDFDNEYCAWYGGWAGDDGRSCFIWISYAPPDRGDEYQMIAGNRNLTIVAGNFDFNFCANVALEKAFG